MCSVFFATHHPNYARWMTEYNINLLNIEHTYESICEVFERGALSIRKTSKSFSYSPVALTLEQTENKDSASRQTGMSNDQKMKETKCTCNLFGKLLVLAASKNVDFATVLSYPLTPGPL